MAHPFTNTPAAHPATHPSILSTPTGPTNHTLRAFNHTLLIQNAELKRREFKLQVENARLQTKNEELENDNDILRAQTYWSDNDIARLKAQELRCFELIELQREQLRRYEALLQMMESQQGR